MMNTIRISEDKTVEVTGFPIYRKDKDHVYKVINTELTLVVCKRYKNLSIMKVHSGLAFSKDEITNCSIHEFIDAYLNTEQLMYELIIKK